MDRPNTEMLNAIKTLESDLEKIDTYLFVYRKMILDEFTESLKVNGNPQSKLYSNWEPSAKNTSQLSLLISTAARKHYQFEMPMLTKFGCAISNLLEINPEPETLVVDVRAELFRLKMVINEDLNRSAHDPEYQNNSEILEFWNSGRTWPEVAEEFCGDRLQDNAIKEQIKRFAKKYNLYIRKGKPGSPRINNSN